MSDLIVGKKGAIHRRHTTVHIRQQNELGELLHHCRGSCPHNCILPSSFDTRLNILISLSNSLPALPKDVAQIEGDRTTNFKRTGEQRQITDAAPSVPDPEGAVGDETIWRIPGEHIPSTCAIYQESFASAEPLFQISRRRDAGAHV